MATTEPRPTPARVEISPAKGREIVGIVLGALGLLLAGSFLSHVPTDPSLLFAGGSDRTRNLIGAVGANLSATGFGFFGIACLLFPVLLLAAAWQRVRPTLRPRVVGRGVGGALLLASLPALLHLLQPSMPWREGRVPSGGAFGQLLGETLESRFNLPGALLVLSSVAAVGLVLLVQTSLGELIAAWRARLAQAWQNHQLAKARRQERRSKEKARRRVIVKHLQRVAEEKRQATSAAADDDSDESDGDRAPDPDLPIDRPAPPPLRVTTRTGEREFAVRRVPPPVAPAPESAPAPPRRESGGLVAPPAAAPAQRALPFPAEPPAAVLPPLNLLQIDEAKPTVDEDELVRLGEAIRSRCAEFGVEGTIEGITPGPVITVYEFQPAPGVKVSQIVNLQDDLALALRAESVRIDRIPGRSTLGIDVPNRQRAMIRLGSMLSQEAFRRSPSILTMAIGVTIQGEPYFADLATMPHLLVAGATGSGKSVGLQGLITSLLYRATRDQVQFIFIDPKRIELGAYADIPHLKAEVVVEPKKAANALRWAVAEMERRYRLLAEVHVRSIDFYNRAIRDPEVRNRLSLSEGEAVSTEDLKPLPYYVIVIDELADLMMVASAEVETAIARIAQMARAVGIHLIVATQRPSVDILTGTIKANFPCRIAFATASRHDSRTILDQVGSEKLLGKGDMLFMPPGTSRTIRLHGAYISEQETAALVRWLKKQGAPQLDPTVLEGPADTGSDGEVNEIDDELFDEAARLVVAERQASASFLQRRMRIGFSRAARLIDIMEREGLLGPQQGSKPRDVLVKPDYFTELDSTRGDR
ncbi:MAG: DNA translocase FtsK [Holophagales bacterium]|nr:MAG: DNA translocase FtsK [Holophagales bacterium]